MLLSGRRRSEIRRTSFRRRFGLRALVWLVRALTIAVMLQFSGVTHHLVDVIHAVEGAALHEAQNACPYEERGDDCPPGCSDCHCTHALRALPVTVPELVGVCEPGIDLAVPYESIAPPFEVAHGLFRPPRALPIA